MLTEQFILPTLLYAETHFRFFGITPSAIFRREPEIVFDLPRRLAPNADLPVVLLVNDAHKFPIEIESVQITVSKIGDEPKLFEFDSEKMKLAQVEHAQKKLTNTYILIIERKNLPSGEFFVNACLRFRRVKKGRAEKKVRVVINDNIPTSTKLSYNCFAAEENYPAQNLCDYGDVHCHTSFSRSHVEWGPTACAIQKICAANGLDFAAATDHSYDLACDIDNYLRQDKKLKSWPLYKDEIKNLRDYPIIIPSEEISVLNSRKKVVHLCGLGISDYISGTLDGARLNVRRDKQYTIAEAVREVERQGGVSIAAHPVSPIDIFQQILLRRGTWSVKDFCAGLCGVQAANGDFYKTWIRAKQFWITMLQSGYRLPILAGSDAHGDFNRYRALAIPFLLIREVEGRHMGFVRTGIYGKCADARDVLSAIKRGATFATSGPFVSICRGNAPDVSVVSSQNISDINDLWVRAISNGEAGEINKIQIFAGASGSPQELLISEMFFEQNTFEAMIPVPIENLPNVNSILNNENNSVNDNVNDINNDVDKNYRYIRAEVHGKSKTKVLGGRYEIPVTAATSAVFF